MTELKNRACRTSCWRWSMGLKGFPEAISAVFPQTHIQTCIVHLTRYSLSLASWQERKHLSGALRSIYRAASAEAAEAELASFAEGPWGKKYPPIVSAWRRNWDQVIPFFAFAPEIRRIVYTTDEIDKRFCVRRGIFFWRGRPRGEARCDGWKRRQVPYSFLAGLRRSRTPSAEGLVFQHLTKRV